MAFRSLSSSVHSIALHSTMLLMMAYDNIRLFVLPFVVAAAAVATEASTVAAAADEVVVVAADVDADPYHFPFVDSKNG